MTINVVPPRQVSCAGAGITGASGGRVSFVAEPDGPSLVQYVIAATASPSRKIHAIAGWRRFLLWPLGLLLRLWCQTLRIDADENSRRAMSRLDRPVIFTLWHNRLFVAAEVYRRFRKGKRLHALVSASKDGAWLAAFFEVVGLHTVRGSSSRLGREAMHQLADCIQQGHDVGITPDGPRGPCYDLKGGSLILARKTGATTILVGMEFTRAWQLPSWDRFYLPRPFSTVRLRAEEWNLPTEEGRSDVLLEVRQRLLAINPD